MYGWVFRVLTQNFPKMTDPESISEQQFVEEALAHKDYLRNWLSSRFSAVKDPEDVVQESYARLFKYHQTGPVVNIRAFLFVTARNLALNEIRRYGYENRSVLLADSMFEHSTTALPIQNKSTCSAEEVELLMEAIQSLPKRCRQVFTLRKIYGLSQREIAERLGMSINTVQNQGVIGLRKCKEYFRKKGILSESQS